MDSTKIKLFVGCPRCSDWYIVDLSVFSERLCQAADSLLYTPISIYTDLNFSMRYATDLNFSM